MGYKRILVRTDGEPAILDLWAKIKEQWSGEIVKVESAVGDHDTNGDAEQAVQKIEDEVRTWRDSTDDSIKDRVPLPMMSLHGWWNMQPVSIGERLWGLMGGRLWRG